MANHPNFGAFSWINPPASSKNQKSRSPTRHPRKSLEGHFENLSVAKSTSPEKHNTPNLSFQRKLLPHLTIFSKAFGGSPAADTNVKFTIRTSTHYREYAVSDDLQALFDEISRIVTELREQAKLDDFETLEAELIESMIKAIYSSNNIEKAGLGLDETWKICLRIFHGEDVKAGNIEERSSEYQNSVEYLLKKHGKRCGNLAWVVRSRREVIQHAKAMEYILQAIVIDDRPLSEEILLETHRMLTDGIDNYHFNGSFTPYQKYGGIYRKVVVGAGNTNFAVPNAVPKLMRRMIEDLNADVAEAGSKLELDPFFLAAKYSNEFVQIHPFEDGNGRLSRLILNAILIKYAGIVVSIGEHDEARAEYIGIMARAGQEMWGGGELALLVIRKATMTLRGLKEKITAIQ